MAAPTYITASTGAYDAGGTWTATGAAPGAADRIIILQIFQDGTTAGAVAITSATNIKDLAGTSNAWTSIATLAVGSPTSGYQRLYIGRSTGTSAPTASGTNSTSEDLFWRFYEFSGASAGTTLATVIENSTGTTNNSLGTGTTVSDASVVTNGADRLALQFVALDAQIAIDAFTGMTGGTWAEAVAEYSTASGTDAAIQLQTATMSSAGTIDGGSDTVSSCGWGVIGFALIPAVSVSTVSVDRTAKAIIKKTQSATFAGKTILLKTISPATYSSTVLADSPISYWRLGETSGTNANDEAGSNDGTYISTPTLGATGLLTGDTDKAVELNGTDEWVTVEDHSTLDQGAGPLSWELWYQRQNSSRTEVLITKGASTLMLYFVGTTLNIAVRGSGTAMSITQTGTDKHHLVVTKDSTSGTAWKLYVDGADVTPTVTSQTPSSNTDKIYMGTDSDTSDPFDGVLDEVAIYGSVLSLAQVQAHYTAGTTGGGITAKAFLTKTTSVDRTAKAIIQKTVTPTAPSAKAVLQKTISAGASGSLTSRSNINDNSLYANSGVYDPNTITGCSGGCVILGTETSTGFVIGQNTGYYIWQFFVDFDTSSIPDDAVITSATLTLTCSTQANNLDSAWDVHARLFDWGSSVTTDDWQDNTELNADTLLAHKASTSFTVDTPIDLTSDALASNINKTGSTRMVLVSSKAVSKSAPTTKEYIQFYSGDYTTESRRPTLTVNYVTGILTYAVIRKVQESSFNSKAIVKKILESTISSKAVVRKPDISSTVDSKAFLLKVVSGQFDAKSWLVVAATTHEETFASKAVLKKTGISGSVSSKAVIKKTFGDYNRITDTFTRTLPSSLGTPDVGGTWSRGYYGGGGTGAVSVNGSQAILAYHSDEQPHTYTTSWNWYDGNERNRFLVRFTSARGQQLGLMLSWNGDVGAEGVMVGISPYEDAYIISTFSLSPDYQGWQDGAEGDSIDIGEDYYFEVFIDRYDSGVPVWKWRLWRADASQPDWMGEQVGFYNYSFDNAVAIAYKTTGSGITIPITFLSVDYMWQGATAKAVLQKTFSQSPVAKAVLQKTISGQFDSRAVLSKTLSTNPVSKAVIRKTIEGSLSNKAVLQKTSSSTASSKSVILKAIETSADAKAVLVANLVTHEETFASKAVLAKTSFGSLSAKSILSKTLTVTPTAKSVLAKSQSGSASSKAILAKTTSQSATSKAILAKTSTPTFASKAILLSANSQTFSTKAILYKIWSSSLSTKSVLFKSSGTKTFDTKAIVQKTLSGETSAKSVVQKTIEPTFSAKSTMVVVGTIPGSFDAKAILAKSIDTSVSAKSYLIRYTETTFASKAALQKTFSTNFNTKGVLRKEISNTFGAAAVGRKVQSGSAESKSVVRKAIESTITAKAQLYMQPRTFASKAVFAKSFSTNINSKAVVRKTFTSTFDNKAILRKTLSGSIPSSADIRKIQSASLVAKSQLYMQPVSIATKAILRKSYETSLSSKALLLKVNSQTLTTKSVIKSSSEASVSSKAVVQRTLENTIGAKSYLVVAGSPTSTFDARAVLAKTISGTLASKSYLVKTAEASPVAKAVLRKETSGSLTANAVVRKVLEGSVGAYTVLRSVQNVNLVSKAVLQKSQLNTFNAGAYLVAQASTFPAKAVLQKTLPGNFSGKSVIQKTLTDGTTSKAVVRKVQDQTLDAKAVLQKAVTGSIGSKSVVQSTLEGSFGAKSYLIVVEERTVNFVTAAVLRKILAGQIGASSVIAKTITTQVIASGVIKKECQSSLSAKAFLVATLHLGRVNLDDTTPYSVELEDKPQLILEETAAEVILWESSTDTM